jgi:hypothetical protein
LHDYLIEEIDNDIETIEATLTTSNFPDAAPAVTLETLVKAQEERGQMERTIEALQRFAKELPEAAREFLLSSQLPPMQNQLEMQDQWIARIQAILENREQSAHNVFTG